jgi:hypothetical protein
MHDNQYIKMKLVKFLSAPMHDNQYIKMNLVKFSSPVLFGTLDPRIVAIIARSIGTIGSNDIQIVGHDDTEQWSILINNPQLTESYIPFFFNRRSEYAKNHSYFEALCHVSPEPDKFKLITSSTARYAKRFEKSYDSRLCPATLAISAFVEQVRIKNSTFLHELLERLRDDGIPHCEEFVDGVFRNVAIQIHFNEKTVSTHTTLHTDHINSCIHMAVTIGGTRNILFVDQSNNEYKKTLVGNDVYLTSPSSILHGIEVPRLDEKNASIALQLRTLLPTNIASVLYRDHLAKICQIVCDMLRKYDGKFLFPTFEQYNAEYLKQLETVQRINKIPKDIPEKIQYTNIMLE